MELLIHVHILLPEILLPHNTEHIQLVMAFLLNHLLCHLDDIVVVGSGQSLIRCHDNTADLSVLYLDVWPRVKKDMIHIRHMTQDSGNRILHIVKVRLRIRKNLLGTFHLRRRNHIHGIGDLHRILDTFHPRLNFFCICHTNTCSCL